MALKFYLSLLVKFATSRSLIECFLILAKLQNSNLFSRKAKKIDPSNDRSISLLPLISKIIETVVHDQTNVFLSANKILCNYQSGFRTNHSTNLCLSFLADKILKLFDKSLLTGMILIDLQKAFDTINHAILLKKLEAISFSDKYIRWFRSYLCERIFFVEIENHLSDYGKVSCGVPQGSILGPRFYFFVAPCLCQRHSSGCKIKYIFICR